MKGKLEKSLWTSVGSLCGLDSGYCVEVYWLTARGMILAFKCSSRLSLRGVTTPSVLSIIGERNGHCPELLSEPGYDKFY